MRRFTDVGALSVAQRAEEAFAVEAALSRVLSHPLGLLKVNVASDFLELAKVGHIFDELVMRAVEASVDVDLVLVHVERRLQR